MPTGFNPFAIPSVPGMPAMPMPKIDPNAGLSALIAVQNAIAKQQALAARAAGHGGGGGGINPKYTNYIDLPDGKGGFETVPVVGADKEGREARAKQLWNQRISQLAAQDESLQKSMSKIGGLSMRGQKAELDKIRQQDLPRLFKQWNLPQGNQADTVRLLTSDIDANITAQKKAIDETGGWQSFADSIKLGWNSLRDAFRSIGKTTEEKFVIDQARSAERQAVIDSNPHLREEELRRREGNDTWTDFIEHPWLNGMEAVGDMLAGAGTIMGGQALGAAGAGALLRAIPTPFTQGAATALQLGGAALGGAAAGAPLGGIELRDRLMSEMNAGNLTREQVLEGIENGETGAQLISGLIAGIPLGVAQTGLPLISRGANTMIGRAAIQHNATKAAAEQLTKETGGLINRAGIAPTAEAMGQNALRNAIAQQANKSFLSRWVGAAGPTALDLGTLSALNTMGSNYAYGEATGQPVDITQGAGQAFLSGAAMGPVFGVLNARRPYVPPQRPVPELPNINTDAYKTTVSGYVVEDNMLPPGWPPQGTGPAQGTAGPRTEGPQSGPRPQGPQSGPTAGGLTGGGAQQQYRQQAQRQQSQQQNTAAQYKSYAEWKKFYENEQATDPLGGVYAQPQREQFVNAADYYRARREHDFNHDANAEDVWRGWAEGTGPEGYYGGDYTASWNGYGGKRGYSTSGTDVVSNIAKKYAGQGNRSALKVKNDITDALVRNDITLDDVMRVADTYAKTDPILYSNLRRAADDYVQQWDNARRSAEQKQQQAQQQAQQGPQQNTQQQARQAAEPNPASKVAPNSKQAKENAANTLRGVSPEMQEAQLKNIFYQMLYNEAINPGSMRLTVKNSHLTSQQRIWAEEAIRNFERYAPEIRKQVEDYARGRQETIGASGASSGSGATPTLGGNEQSGQGSTNRTNTTGDSAAAANTQTTAADIADEYFKRIAGGDNSLEGRGYAGLPAQDTGAIAAIADFVRSSPLPLRNKQQAPNGKSGSGQPAEQSAKPDTRQRGNQPPANAGTRSNGTSESVGDNQPDTVNATANYQSAVLERHPLLETDSAIALDQTLEVALDEKYNKTQMLQAVKEWANNMVKSGEPVQEIRDAFALFNSLPQLHKSTAKAVDNILKKAEKAENTQPTNTKRAEAEQKILSALEGIGNYEAFAEVTRERAEKAQSEREEKAQPEQPEQHSVADGLVWIERNGKRWTKGGHDRTYINVDKILHFLYPKTLEVNKRGEIIRIDGLSRAKSSTAKIDLSGVYYDNNAGYLEIGKDTVSPVSRAIFREFEEKLGLITETPTKKAVDLDAIFGPPQQGVTNQVTRNDNISTIPAHPEQRTLFDDIQENAEQQAVDEATTLAEIEQTPIEQNNIQKPQATKRTTKKTVPKTEIQYAQNVGEIRRQLEKLSGDKLTEGGEKAAFDGYEYEEAINEGVRIMEEKAAGKKLAPDEEHSYKMMKKYGIQDLNPVVTENAKAAAQQGKKLNMKTTEQGQATITRRTARKKVNDPNSETCGLG